MRYMAAHSKHRNMEGWKHLFPQPTGVIIRVCANARLCALPTQQSLLLAMDVATTTLTTGSRLASSSRLCRPSHSAASCRALDFNDHRSAFKHKTTWELYRGLLVLRLCSSDILVDNSLTLMRVGRKFLGDRLLGLILNPTIYAQFVAGIDEESLSSVARHLQEQSLRLMVAPALEEDVDEAVTSRGKYDSNLSQLLKLAEMTARQGGTSPSLQCKMSGLLPARVLQNVSSTFPKPRKEIVEYLASEIMHRIVPDEETGCPALWPAIKLPGISDQDLKEITYALERLATLGEYARQKSLVLLVDAEWSYINPCCSLLALAMMAAFNKSQVTVTNTYQCYFKNAQETLKSEIDICEKLGFSFAAKFVRGAYLEREKQINPSNVCSSHQETGENYKRVLDSAFEHATTKSGSGSLVIVATHNEDAISYATDKLRKVGSSRENGNVAFAQIYGMAEQISMPLAQAKYVVYKSVPIGPLPQMLPYLSRRVAENRSVLKGARKERELLEMELLWRIKTRFQYLP